MFCPFCGFRSQPFSNILIFVLSESRIVRQNGFRVCPHFVGHGIGSFFHGHPEVWHHGKEVPLLRSVHLSDLGLHFPLAAKETWPLALRGLRH